MKRSGDLTAINWPYVGSLVSIVTFTFGWMAWRLTAPAVGSILSGDSVPRGWSWGAILLFDGFLLAVYAALLWKVYKDKHTLITHLSISQPSLRGRQEIPWPQVRRVHGNSFVVHLHGIRSHIIVTTYAYRDPHAVIAAILDRAPPGAAA
jgi:hypothetical protein